MKRLIIIFIAGLLAVSLTACANGVSAKAYEPAEEMKTSENEGASSDKGMMQTGYTLPVPEEYLKTAARQGSVVKIDYTSRDYVREGAEITKTAYVYLPYGYDEEDEETRYDIVYLMHGWGGHAGEYFEYVFMKNLFDNMIEKGDISPVIIVSPSFYNKNSDTGFNGSIEELRQFHRDFRENLMPAVEGMFHTYAESVSKEDLAASRDHRVFGGFSLGSVTTWLEFCYDYDYIRYFLPMSGSCWYYGTYGDFQIENNANFIEQLVKDNKLDERGYFIYHAVGTLDEVKSQSIMMADEMLERNDVFTPEHYVFYQKDGGYHDFVAVQEYLYNALPEFFSE
ncbi:MAG: glycoside hydrolase [Firmicutes bacterium]|nr:glycoside hydrolase [Bacillota bacterium]